MGRTKTPLPAVSRSENICMNEDWLIIKLEGPFLVANMIFVSIISFVCEIKRQIYVDWPGAFGIKINVCSCTPSINKLDALLDVDN